jgi:hypothetical protein
MQESGYKAKAKRSQRHSAWHRMPGFTSLHDFSVAGHRPTRPPETTYSAAHDLGASINKQSKGTGGQVIDTGTETVSCTQA